MVGRWDPMLTETAKIEGLSRWEQQYRLRQSVARLYFCVHALYQRDVFKGEEQE